MRRAVLGLAGLAASTTLLVVVKGAADATPTPVSAPAVPSVPPSGSPAPPAGGPAASGGPDGSPAPTATSKKPKPKKTTSTRPPDDDGDDEPAPPPPPSNRKTFTGTREQNPYGAVQLEITVQGTRMVDIRAIEMPDSESRSDQLSDQVSVQLREEALQEQGSDLDTVSGATETSVSYRDSLRAAIEEWK